MSKFPLSPAQLANLRALVDRIIPADEFPGALAAGTDSYVVRQLEENTGGDTPALLEGLTFLDAEAAARSRNDTTFSLLPATEQDALLTALEKNLLVSPWTASFSPAAFFNRFVELAHEGFYADPSNHGNRSAVSWQMLNYDPRLPPSV